VSKNPFVKELIESQEDSESGSESEEEQTPKVSILG
jgi:hypothetical protein